MVLPPGRGDPRPVLSGGEKVPEGRMRGDSRLGSGVLTPPGLVVFREGLGLSDTEFAPI